MTRTRRLRTSAVLAALSLPAILGACTPREIETSIHAGVPCAERPVGQGVQDSDGTTWSSATCASHAKVDLTQGGWPSPPTSCDPAIDALPTTEDQSFAGWRPPACFESDVQPASGPAPIIGSPGHGA